MAPRLIVHAGFHKTGTSSVQKMLEQGRPALTEALRPLVKADIPEMCAAARDYALQPEPLQLTLFAYEVARVFEGLDPADPRTVLISSEDLAGLIPGRRRRLGYPAAATLMKTLIETASEAWGRPLRSMIYFSTRAPEPWMRSCYNQHLRATRITEDFESYRAWQAPCSDLHAIARQVAGQETGALVIDRPLEKMVRMPHGPLTPVFRFADVPDEVRAQVRKVGRVNRSLPADVQAGLLALNRSDLKAAELKIRKQALISGARQGRTTAGPETRRTRPDSDPATKEG